MSTVNGAEVDKPGDSGAAPLFLASEEGHDSVCRLLLQNGAFFLVDLEWWGFEICELIPVVQHYRYTHTCTHATLHTRDMYHTYTCIINTHTHATHYKHAVHHTHVHAQTIH